MPGSRKVWSVSSLLLVAVCLRLPAQEASASLEARASTLISLSSRVIDTSRPQPEVSASLRVRPEDSLEDEIVLVKFPAPPNARQIEALRKASLEVYTYLPYYTYLVKMPAGKRSAADLSKLGASWSGPYQPLYKISPGIAAVAEDKARGGEIRPVMVQVYPDADLGEVVRKIRDLGIKGVVGSRHNQLFSRVRLLLSAAEIAALREPLAGLRDVFWIDLEGRRTLRNDTTVWVGQSGLSGGQTTPIFSQGIFGEGQTVGIIDTGIDPDSCYFRDTARGLPPTNACNGGTVVDTAQRKIVAVDFLWSTDCAGGIASTEWDTQNHGTHVAGTVGGTTSPIS